MGSSDTTTATKQRNKTMTITATVETGIVDPFGFMQTEDKVFTNHVDYHAFIRHLEDFDAVDELISTKFDC